MGDVGSTFLGFSFAALVLLGNLGVGGGRLPIEFGIVILAPFLFDSIVTLARRVARGERWYAAHRSHYYQRLVVRGARMRKSPRCTPVGRHRGSRRAVRLQAGELLRQALAVAAYVPMLVGRAGWRLRRERCRPLTKLYGR
jgi:hypothetical protein